MIDLRLKKIIEQKRIRKEREKLEREMLYSFKSSIPVERLRMQKKLIELAKSNPSIIAPLLLKNYHHNDEDISHNIRATLAELADLREFREAVTDLIRTPDREMRRGLLDFVKEYVGFHAVTFLSFYEQTAALIELGKRKEIPMDDIEALVEISKSAFIDGYIFDAVKDIALCLDLVKHRHRSVEQLKNYLQEVLKIAPELNRMGVFSGRLEEPLRKAVKSSKHLKYDETHKIVRERKNEIALLNEMRRIGKLIKTNVKEVPHLEISRLKGMDVWVLTILQQLMDSVMQMIVTGKQGEAKEYLLSFLTEDFREFFSEHLEERVTKGDPSALFTIYAVGITTLKLASYVLPLQSEEIYQNYYRELEGEPSIYLVSWPGIVEMMLSPES